MKDTTSAAPARRKTEQAVKISASWTPSEMAGRAIRSAVFGGASPLFVRGGRMTINAAIALDMTDPAQAGRVAARESELRKELEATGTVHSFVAAAGAVPAGDAEHLPEDKADA